MKPVPEPAADSPTWPLVLAFAKRMEAKLARNRHKGDAEGWRCSYFKDLQRRIVDESQELEIALSDSVGSWDDVANEAADIANFAMMIADKAELAGKHTTATP